MLGEYRVRYLLGGDTKGCELAGFCFHRCVFIGFFCSGQVNVVTIRAFSVKTNLIARSLLLFPATKSSFAEK